MKRKVRIRVESKQKSDRNVQQMQGELHMLRDVAYWRYAETDPGLGRTMTTVKWDGRQIKIIRHGDVESEMTFSLGERTAGTYALAQGRLRLEMATRKIDCRLEDGLGSLTWSYDLYSDGIHTGRTQVRLLIEEEGTE